MRAISRLASVSRVVFSSAPVADWKRRLNSSCRVSTRCVASWSFVRSRRSLAFKDVTFPAHELRLDEKLLTGQAKRVLGQFLRHPGEIEHHAARLDDRDPALRRPLALARPRLSRLLRVRLA